MLPCYLTDLKIPGLRIPGYISFTPTRDRSSGERRIICPLNALATERPAGVPLNVQTDISVFVGRGMLIESQGPTWLYGTASEHAQMYQYQLLNAANIYMGHLQTETPYYQPKPNASRPTHRATFPRIQLTWTARMTSVRTHHTQSNIWRRRYRHRHRHCHHNYKGSHRAERLTTTYPASLGVVGMAAAWRMGYRNFVVSDYDLDFYSISETKNICQVKFSPEYGAARPRPKTWSDILQSVTFFSDLDVLSTKYTNCIYTNAAAPSPGDGGTVSCDGLTLPCYVYTGPPMGCNPDMFFGWLTSVKPLVNCPVATMTSSVYTKTTAVTETLVTTIP
ncbi:uncharacterized protein NFIA_092710 [Aspergillus fischeri NRRL 181]|uniref:Uncharacterized protein n=1 Tax=Neosartorya fischeri (strain ATCC 1020 / DSM 3700 / CBS 544.65 / FGSC A1164 / JCM 1740 / NRRL 181 / WB 181) TaxID=331117 RepID=A1DIV3_NEOFI|nr:uncharacterized protein NFIA_092710 [Aspergillus fischeri NRRL 181]EAW19310.1 hypothetical protein NFIA_092710 [Aspergillus fischeri NRRL 181]KAG2010878.1 hypothetical protein GB937_007422 [Aspergillus fischeri]